MEPIAYGALALTPWEFGQLTPGEFQQMIDGYLWRKEQKQWAAAQLVAPIINTCTNYELKRPVTVDMLLGIEPAKKKSTDKTQEQVKAEMAKLIAKVG